VEEKGEDKVEEIVQRHVEEIVQEQESGELLECPACGRDLDIDDERLLCHGCGWGMLHGCKEELAGWRVYAANKERACARGHKGAWAVRWIAGREDWRCRYIMHLGKAVGICREKATVFLNGHKGFAPGHGPIGTPSYTKSWVLGELSPTTMRTSSDIWASLRLQGVAMSHARIRACLRRLAARGFARRGDSKLEAYPGGLAWPYVETAKGVNWEQWARAANAGAYVKPNKEGEQSG
jgi:hypothetical protein